MEALLIEMNAPPEVQALESQGEGGEPKDEGGFFEKPQGPDALDHDEYSEGDGREQGYIDWHEEAG